MRLSTAAPADENDLLCTVKRENGPILPEELALKMILEIDVSPQWEAHFQKKTFTSTVSGPAGCYGC